MVEKSNVFDMIGPLMIGLDGYNANFSANLHTLIIKADDVKGSIAYIAE